MKIKRTLRALTVAALGGAAAAYVLDPVAGRRRRETMVRGLENRAADVRDLARKTRRAKAAVVTGGDVDTDVDEAEVDVIELPEPEPDPVDSVPTLPTQTVRSADLAE